MQRTPEDARIHFRGHLFRLSVGAVLLSLCVTSCAERERAGLSAYVHQEMVRPPGEEHKFIRDGVSRLVFLIENDSEDVVVLRNCSIPGQLPDIDRWHGARYGSVEHRPLEDVWWYHEMAQQLSEPVFAMGVIPPGGSLKVARWAILRDPHVTLDVAYHRLTPEQARRYLYVETVRDDSIGSNRVFKHPQEISHAAAPTRDTHWHVVIFPEADTLEIGSQTLTCPVTLREPPVDIAAAQAIVGEPIVDSVYGPRRQAWVVQTVQSMCLVVEDTFTPLPTMDLLPFVVIEAAYRTVPFLLPEKGYDRFKSEEEDEEDRFADAGVTQVPHSAVRDLLARAREHGHRITVRAHDPTGLGARFCLKVGNGHEN